MPAIRKQKCLQKYLLVHILVCTVMSPTSFEVRAQTGSNGHDATEPEGMVDVAVNASQCGSADLAMMWVEHQIWFPSPGKDGCQQGAAGTHTFTLKPGFSGPLTVYPIEAIQPDDGTVSLWWNVWSDDPVWIDGSTGTVSGGSGNIAPQSHHIQAPALELKSVQFFGHEIVHDDGSVFPVPHWQRSDDSDYTPSPVAFVRNSTIEVEAIFQIDPDMNGQTLYIKGDGPGNLDFPVTVATVSENTLTVLVSALNQLPNIVTLFEPFTIEWQYAQASDATSWITAGTSENLLYVTFDEPNSHLNAPPLTRPIYHTLLHVGCHSAQGSATEASVLERIWEAFQSWHIAQITPDGTEGEPLTYYGTFDHTDVQTTAGLLQYNDGICDAWARAFIDTLKIQGLSYTTSIVTVEYIHNALLGSNGWFFVSEWTFQTPSNSDPDPDYPYENVKANPWVIHHDNDALPDFSIHWEHADVIDQQGIAGQSIENPHAIFQYHTVVYLSSQGTYNPEDTHYDPSYGERYNTLMEIDRIIAGYGYLSTPLFSQPVFHLQQNFDDGNFPFVYNVMLY
ncbi:hypothetical protein JW979_08650 [bacterium]|nr:hypothetical protein [candidate division CSSED10-310 bacterium]